MNNMQNVYWDFLTQSKFELCYYDIYRQQSIKTDKWITIILAVFSSGAVSAWLTNDYLGKLYGAIIIIMQVLSVANLFLPFQKRAKQLSDLISKLSPIYNTIEKSWYNVSSGELSNSEINDLLYEYKNQWDSISSQYFTDDALPENKKITSKANEVKEKYFENKFSGGIVNANRSNIIKQQA